MSQPDIDSGNAGDRQFRELTKPTADESASRVPTVEQNAKVPTEVNFSELSSGGDIVIVRFGTNRYQLKRTRSGRLVLHK
ncbi:MAG: hypothetical protein AAFV88_06500 [Planctomycetota bacterium]